MSPHCSRKTFFAKLGGLIAAVGIVPALFAKTASPTAPVAASPFALRPDQRAVARKAGSF